MKLRKIITACVLSMSVLFISCDDFLTQENINKASTDQLYESLADCEYGFAALYNAFKATNIYCLTDEMMRSDIAVQGNRSSNSTASYIQTFTNAYSSASNKWAALYTLISRANQLITGCEGMQEWLTTDYQFELLEYYKGHGYFMRGLAYFWLHNSYNFGSVPLVTIASTGPETIHVPLSTSDEVRDFYRADLLEAAFQCGLDDDWSSVTEWTGIATTAACVAILGQSYLYEASYKDTESPGSGAAEFEIAATYFKQIIDSGSFSLANINENMTDTGEFNSESILEVNYTTEYNSDFSSSSNYLYNTWNMNLSNLGGYTTIAPAMWLCEEFRNDPVDPLNSMNWTEVKLDADGDLIFNACDRTWGSTVSSGDVTTITSYVYVTDKEDGVPKMEFRNDGNYYLCFETDGGDLRPKYVTITTTYDDYGDSSTTTSTVKTGTTFANLDSDIQGTVKLYTANIKVVSTDDDLEDWKLERLREYTLRKSYTIADAFDIDVQWYMYPVTFGTTFANYSCGYFRALTNWETVTDEDYTVPTQTSAINYRLMRLADVYLMYAECLLELGRDLNEAQLYINRVRYRAGATLLGNSGVGEYESTEATYDGVTYTYDELIDHLRYVERPLELTVYGHAIRLCDMRRWGITAARFTELSKIIRYTGQLYTLNDSSDGLTLAVRTNANGRYTKTETEELLTANPDWASWWAGEEVVDYVYAARNYSDADNSYWKIPVNEVLANPYIN